MKYILFKIAANSSINWINKNSISLRPSGSLDTQEYGDQIFVINNKDFLFCGKYIGKNGKGEWIVENIREFPIKILSNSHHSNISESFHRTIIFPGANQGSRILKNDDFIKSIFEFLDGDDTMPSFQKWLGLKKYETN